MKKFLIKVLVLMGVFCLGILVFGQMTNHANEDLTTEMADATLPLVSLYTEADKDGTAQEINELHGYTSQMDAVYMRDTITPVAKDRKIAMQIQTYDTDVDGISYEIRSLDTTRLISDNKVTDYNSRKGQITADLTVQNLLEEDQEYLLIIELSAGDKTIYYYTRIIEESTSQAASCVRFAMDFHDMTFDADKAKGLATYLEPNASGDNSTLQKVDIHSSLKQVTWADLGAERLTTPVPSIKEITDSYTVVVLDYLVGATGDAGELEYYSVEEDYRIRYTSDRMYLLNYERTMNEIFMAEHAQFYDNYIQLGIREGEVEYTSNEKGDIVCFVQEGELWCFNETTNQLAKVFGFRGSDGMDARENYGEHDIRIINIDETGSVNFVVYGYMNRGRHEGQTGICVYHYDSVANTVEEELFIPSDQSYQVMKADLGQLMYESIQGAFYIMLDGTVYQIDLATMDTKEYITGLTEGSYAISDSHKYFAWTEGENIYGASKITIADLDTGKQREITSQSDAYMKPLGFMDDDFVYGTARSSDVLTDLAGNVTFPMYKVTITDSSTLEELKTYQKDGYFVSGIEVRDYIMYLNRLQYNGMAYVAATQDTIMNREGDSTTIVDVHTTVTDRKETQVQLSMAGMVKEASPKILTPKEVVLEQSRDVTLKTENREHRYYAYARGDVLRVTDDLTDAISVANEQMGVVLGDSQQYVWMRARKSAQSPIQVQVGTEDAGGTSIAQCVSAMLEQESVNIGVTALITQGKTPKEILETTMENVTALDLTGCELDEVLYYISLGNPVFAMSSNTDAVLLVGYDSANIYIYNPLTLTTEKMALTDAVTLFSNAGNVFFGYITT